MKSFIFISAAATFLFGFCQNVYAGGEEKGLASHLICKGSTHRSFAEHLSLSLASHFLNRSDFQQALQDDVLESIGLVTNNTGLSEELRPILVNLDSWIETHRPSDGSERHTHVPELSPKTVQSVLSNCHVGRKLIAVLVGTYGGHIHDIRNALNELRYCVKSGRQFFYHQALSHAEVKALRSLAQKILELPLSVAGRPTQFLACLVQRGFAFYSPRDSHTKLFVDHLLTTNLAIIDIDKNVPIYAGGDVVLPLVVQRCAFHHTGEKRVVSLVKSSYRMLLAAYLVESYQQRVNDAVYLLSFLSDESI